MTPLTTRLLIALIAARGGPPFTARGTILDAATAAPVVAADVRVAGSAVVSDARGRFAISARTGDTIRVRRIGYRTAAIPATPQELTVRLRPLALRLTSVDVAGDAPVGAVEARASVRRLERGAAVSTAEAITRLPFVSARSSRGGVALSMRGSRPEQVAVLLDGVPLNDPATGVADISDLPLIALGSLAAAPGSALTTAGAGAGGGVLALGSGTGSVARAVSGAYGRLGIGGAHAMSAGRAVVRAGGDWSSARNDFPFVNTVAPTDTVERRTNSDEHRVALFATATAPGARAIVLVSRTERGLVGPMNVHAFDAARGQTRRALLGVAGGGAGWTATGGLRALDLRYRHPGLPGSRALSLSADGEVAGRGARLSLRAGAGADRVTATGLRDELRPRAFAAAEREVRRGRWRGSAALRADAIRDGGAHLSPSAAIERAGAVSLFARAAQAFRAPTFYDLYVATPQWVGPARTLRPERVAFDGEFGARAALGTVAFTATLFERLTRDAIVWFPGTFEWSPKNVARERARGVEARLSASGAASGLDAWLSVRSARLDVDGARVASPYVPAADGGASARARTGRLELSAALQVIGRRPIALVPRPSRGTELPMVALLDAAASWRVRLSRVHADASAGVHNAADVRWQPIDRFPAPGRSWVLAVTVSP